MGVAWQSTICSASRLTELKRLPENQILTGDARIEACRVRDCQGTNLDKIQARLLWTLNVGRATKALHPGYTLEARHTLYTCRPCAQTLVLDVFTTSEKRAGRVFAAFSSSHLLPPNPSSCTRTNNTQLSD